MPEPELILPERLSETLSDVDGDVDSLPEAAQLQNPDSHINVNAYGGLAGDRHHTLSEQVVTARVWRVLNEHKGQKHGMDLPSEYEDVLPDYRRTLRSLDYLQTEYGLSATEATSVFLSDVARDEMGGGMLNTAITMATVGGNNVQVHGFGVADSVLMAQYLVDNGVIPRLEKGRPTESMIIDLPDDRIAFVLRNKQVSTKAAVEGIQEVKPKLVTVSSVGGDMELFTSIIEEAKSVGATVSVNMGYKEIRQIEKYRDKLALVDLLTSDEKEATEILSVLGVSVDNPTLQQLASFISKAVCQVESNGLVVVSSGPEGLAYSQDKGKQVGEMPADFVPEEEFESSLGGGDGAHARLALGRAKGESPEVAAKGAVSVGAAVVKRRESHLVRRPNGNNGGGKKLWTPRS
ncbi:carbohydrate kinase family protein [Candidatus Saccharibacteria bacterium]|nr:carbohydrate kinase family protein [Candidatus Saccharibacteria bacterium]